MCPNHLSRCSDSKVNNDGIPVLSSTSVLVILSCQLIPVIRLNVLIHTVSSVPDTFDQLAKKIFLMLPQVGQIHFVTDTYKELSIKSRERIRHGTAETLIIHGSATKVK